MRIQRDEVEQAISRHTMTAAQKKAVPGGLLLLGAVIAVSPVTAARAHETGLDTALPVSATSPVSSNPPTTAHTRSRRAQLTSAQYLILRRLQDAVSWGVHLDSDMVSNRHGGLRTGTAKNTVLHAGVALDTQKMGGWPGGRFRIDVTHIQGDRPSANLVGDAQGVSNLSAVSANRLYSAWYEQRVGQHATYRLGLIDLNAYFDVTEAAGSLINSSFGITPTIASNVTSSIYPKPGYGLMAESHSPDWQFRAGVFQGDPQHRASVLDRGQMVIGEAVRSRSGRYGGLYKFGAWQYENPKAAVSGTQSRAWGLYGVVVQPISRHAPYRDRRLFLQWGANPGGTDPVPYYLGFGADFFKPFAGRPDDRVSLGVARAWLRGLKAETTFEASYVYQVNRWLWMQPDVQYVRNPGGTAPDALVMILRAHISFGE